MSNVKFVYLYRDAGNYKRWGQVVFSNAEGISLQVIQDVFRNAFDSDSYFIAQQIRVPELFLWNETPATTDDHCFHEFAAVEACADTPTDDHGRSIKSFLLEVKREAKRGWQAFELFERGV